MDDATKNTAAATGRLHLGDVPATALMTLACRAAETQLERPILRDPLAAEWLATLRPRLESPGAESQPSARLLEAHPATQVYVALRAREFDRITAAFLRRHPQGVVTTLGCGFDTRFARVGDSGGRFVELDVPEIIAARRVLPRAETDGPAIACDVMDFGWMTEAATGAEAPMLFLAEGLFMYLKREAAEVLVGELERRFPGSEMVCEVFNSFWLAPGRREGLEVKLQRELGFGPGAMFRSGVAEAAELAAWGRNIEILGEWMHLDEEEARLGRLRKLRHFPQFRRRQWVVHCRLGGA